MSAALERDTLRSVRWRLLPFLFLLYIVSWLDRVNVGFAALQMNRDLRLSPAAYGFAAGVLSIGYAICEIPSTLVLYRVGARRWIARIMVSWGLLSAATMFVTGPTSLYVLRFLLGVAEAGFFPGMVFYLSEWFPRAERARALSLFMAAIPLSSVVGGPLAGVLLGLDGWHALRGWQWLFLGEGIPAMVLGIVVFLYLPDRPSEARWLAPDAQAWLSAELAAEQSACRERHGVGLRAALMHPAVWKLGLVYFTGSAATYGLTLWVPQVVKGLSGLSDFSVSMVSVLPYIVAAAATVYAGVHSDRTGERPLHVVLSYLIAVIGFLASAAAHSPKLALLALTIAAVGTFSRNGPFWAMPSMFLTGSAAAGGIALINSFGALGGFSGPYVIGLVKSSTGSYAGGFTAIAFMLLIGVAIILHLRSAPVLADDRPPAGVTTSAAAVS